jgi:hypothetical protein
VAPSSAEELRIGYVAPITDIFAQVGKDMIDGFQLYLDEVNSDFGGAKVKFSRPPAAASFVKISPPFHHNGAGIERDDLRRRGDTESRQCIERQRWRLEVGADRQDRAPFCLVGRVSLPEPLPFGAGACGGMVDAQC